jgi:hypothetical protein
MTGLELLLAGCWTGVLIGVSMRMLGTAVSTVRARR